MELAENLEVFSCNFISFVWSSTEIEGIMRFDDLDQGKRLDVMKKAVKYRQSKFIAQVRLSAKNLLQNYLAALSAVAESDLVWRVLVLSMYSGNIPIWPRYCIWYTLAYLVSAINIFARY